MSFFNGQFFGGSLFGAGTFFGGEFFGGDFFSTDVTPPVVEVLPTTVGGRHHRRIPRYILVNDEEGMPIPQAAVPFAPRPIAVMLPRLTSFEAGIEAEYVQMLDPAHFRVKQAPSEWDEDEEWLLMH